jgi:serine/threonine-protein kinase ATR
MLQAQRADAPFSFIQSARLVKASGEPIRALQELNKAMEKSSLSVQGDVIDLTEAAVPVFARMKAKVYHCLLLDWTLSLKLIKAHVLRARWMYDAERFEMEAIHMGFKEAVSLAHK